MDRISWINLYTTDPTFNLAAEQYVFSSLPKDRSYFMLWQNDNAVIVGKFQNTQAEIDEKYIEENNIKVVRRLSGGGAVYHDLGNLNFTFITDAKDLERLNMKIFCEPIANVLKDLGANAEINGRNDITIDGKKFSGNSQYISGGRIMHHGTIMFDSNLDVLTKALAVDPSKIESKGMKSVRSRVTNIKEHIKENISIEDFRKELLKRIAIDNGGEEYRFTDNDLKAINAIQKDRYLSWEWNYGKSPEGHIKKSQRIPGCGKIEAYITTEHGRISSVIFHGDYFSTEDPEILADKFVGYTADEKGYISALTSVDDVSLYFSGLSKDKLLKFLTLNNDQ